MMKTRNTRWGFTLIELLVVVLIIGILSAVALPQYQKSVEKAHMVEAISIITKIAQAQELYRLEHGNFTRDITQLTLDIPGTSTTYAKTISAIQTPYFKFMASNSLANGHYSIALAYHDTGRRYMLTIHTDLTRGCNIYDDTKPYQQKLCQDWAAGKW